MRSSPRARKRGSNGGIARSLGAGERFADAAPHAAAERHVQRVPVVAVGAEGVRVRERVRVAVGEQ